MFAAGTRTFSNVDLGVAVRRVVVAEHREQAHDLHAGRVDRHQDHRLLLVAVGVVGVGLAHEDEILQRGSAAPEVHHLRPLIT